MYIMVGLTLFPTTLLEANREISRLRGDLGIAEYNLKSCESKCKKLKAENESLRVELKKYQTLAAELEEALQKAVEEDTRKTQTIAHLLDCVYGSHHEGRRTIQIDESLDGRDLTSILKEMEDLLESDLAQDPDAEAATATNAINGSQQTPPASNGKAKEAKSTIGEDQQDGSVSGGSAQPTQSTTTGKSQQTQSGTDCDGQQTPSETPSNGQQTPSETPGNGQQTPSETTDNSQESPKGPRIPDPSPVRGTNRLKDILETIQDPVADIPEEDRICPHCGKPMSYLGTKMNELVDYKPAEFFIRQQPRKLYECKACAGEENHKVVREAEPTAVAAVPGSFLSAAFLAHVVSDRYVDSLPIYRIARGLEYQGIPLYRQTINNNLILASEYLAPLVDLIHREMLQYPILHADETVWHVLLEPDKAPTALSYLWIYCTGRGAPHPAVFYEYAPGRGSRYPKAFLNYNDLVFTGLLQCDGYVGYNFVEEMTNVDRVACLAHIRRRFYQDAKLTLATGESSPSVRGYMFCNALFDLEERFADLTEQDRYIARLEYSVPILDAFEAWLEMQTPQNDKFGAAVTYALNEFSHLRNFLKNGNTEISNNRAENAVRPVVIGRKNSLFNTSVNGAIATTRYYTLVETALHNGLDPYEYFKWLFTKIPRMTDLSPEALEPFLPWNAPESCRRREIPKRPLRDGTCEFKASNAYQNLTLPGLTNAILTFIQT